MDLHRSRSVPARAAASGGSGDGRRQAGSWLERWLATTSDLARLQYAHRMVDAVIDEIDGRMVRIGDRWLADFASCNYLGFDLEPQIIDAVEPYLRAWGTHPSWSRLLGSPVLYEQIEEQLTALLGADDSLVLPTITHIHTSVVPVLAGEGDVFLDGRAHKTIYDGCALAAAHGANVQRYPHDDIDALERMLRVSRRTPKLICTDGVNSMTGNAPDVRRLARLAREYDALLYVDDAHGFGVIGERGPGELCDWGMRGNGLVRHEGETYENVVLVAGFSKSYSSLLAFIACPRELKQLLKTAAPPYLYSGPSPVASLATVLEGFKVNEQRGDLYRQRLHAMTHRVLDRLAELDVYTPNESGYPIVEIPLARAEDIDAVGDYLFDHGVYATLAAYPLVPRDEVGFRVQLTAANTDREVDMLLDAVEAVADRLQRRTEPREGRTAA
jgi:8-amino-7-oxononanoate synthase